MLKAYKYRLYPNKSQTVLLDKHIGSCRFIYNLALEVKQTAYAGNKTNLSCFAITKQLPDLKKECEWLKEINSQSLQQAIVNMDTAFTNFFKGRSEFPKYKSKHKSNNSFRVPQGIKLNKDNNKLFIPKFRNGIPIKLHRDFKGEIRQCTISKTPTNKYFVSILVDNYKELPSKFEITGNNSVGIDLGIKDFAITSAGEVFDNPKYYKKNLLKLKYIQRKYSKHKGKRTKYKLALQHEKVANKRKDFLHKTSSILISENQTICLEDLNIKGMIKRCKPKKDENGNYIHNGQAAKSGLNKSISDVGWGMFIDMLAYKAEWNGNNIIRIGRFDPSSKLCSNCGYIKKDLTLNDREWICPVCGIEHDRDINAAINIKAFALKDKLYVERIHKNQNELFTLVKVMTSEAQVF